MADERPAGMVHRGVGQFLGRRPVRADPLVCAFAQERRVTPLRAEFEMVALERAWPRAELQAAPSVTLPQALSPVDAARPLLESLASPQQATRRPVALRDWSQGCRELELRLEQQALPRLTELLGAPQEPAGASLLLWLRRPSQLFQRWLALPRRHPRQPTCENAPAP